MRFSPLRQRIRDYEDAYRIKLPKRTPIIIRVDGRAFHTLTKKFKKPWDADFIEAMNATAIALCKEIQGAQIAYVQSDEITVFIRNYNKFETSPWFDNVLQKMCSVSASIATKAFNKFATPEGNTHKWSGTYGTFDSRVFCVPREEVCNVFVDRQIDCVRNSILSLGQFIIGKKAIHGLSCSDIKDRLNLHGSQMITRDNVTIGEGGWDNCSTWQKFGRVVSKEIIVEDYYVMNPPDPKLNWQVMEETPVFKDNRHFIDNLVWPKNEEGQYSTVVHPVEGK